MEQKIKQVFTLEEYKAVELLSKIDCEAEECDYCQAGCLMGTKQLCIQEIAKNIVNKCERERWGANFQ